MFRTIVALLFLTALCPAGGASALQLLVLGSGGPRAFGRAGSSYIVIVDGTPRILVDAGPGAFLRIGELKVDLQKVDTILLTHLHIDHSGDIAGFFKARTLSASAPSIRFAVFGPDGGGLFPSTVNFVNLLFASKGAWAYQKTFGANENIEAVNLPIKLDSAQQTILDKDGLRITSVATHHGDCPSVAYRIDYKTESIVFSGDMDASALTNIEKLAKNCDLLVFNCAVLDPPDSPSQLYALHTPPRKIGEAAQVAGAKRLLLSHIAPAIEDGRVQVLASVRRSYKGAVQLAQDKMLVAVRWK
jgi:ribonuclease BN (tRNA processing enzyme)